MASFIQRTMHYRKEHTAWQAKYDVHAPKAGDPAPDFELSDVDGEQSICLSDFRGKKPVALVFGSFT
jgi:peroxiredoxin